MKTYIIHPSAPLIFRSGKPFGSGSRDGANFPWPSSIAGALRTAWWDNVNDQTSAQDLLRRQSSGPLLALLQQDKVIPLIHKPADALYLLQDESSKDKAVHALRPQEHDPGTGSNLPEGLLPVRTEGNAPVGKPQNGPLFWRLEDLLQWQCGYKPDFGRLNEIKPLESDPRTHVAIDRDLGAAEEGKLFQTEGLIFHQTTKNLPQRVFGLLTRFEGDLPDDTAITLGGERRLSWIAKAQHQPLQLPAEHRKALVQARYLVIHLGTPALFAGGWKPGWLDSDLTGTPPGCDGLVLRLKAVAMERWQSISGWDLANNRPRASRKAVPAGSAFWFEIVGTPPDGWADKLWLAELSDDKQDRLNGFGLAVPGPCKYFLGDN